MRADTVIRRVHHALMVDEDGGALHDVDIAIAEGRIAAIGPALKVEADTEIDGRACLAMPGMVNLHTHLPMTLLRGVAENVDLQGFLECVWAEEARIMDPRGTYVGARLGALECLLSGTTTALDMYFHHADAHRGAVEVGLRHVIGPVFFSFPGPDGLSWEERMAQAQQWPEALAAFPGPFVPPALMPHAAFTVGVEHLAQVASLALEQGALVTTHASENIRENEDTLAATGMRPVPALNAAGLLALAPVLAHGVRLDLDERRTVAAAGAAVAHCPGSNLKLASGALDLVGYRADGITVGLGTDGCSSSNDLDMFAVLRLAANLARLVRDDPAAISARDVVGAATLAGARALRLDDRIGTLEVGKEADIVLVDLDAPHLVPIHDPYTAVVFSAGRADVRDVFVAGERVIADRRSTRVSHEDVMSEAIGHVGTWHERNA